MNQSETPGVATRAEAEPDPRSDRAAATSTGVAGEPETGTVTSIAEAEAPNDAIPSRISAIDAGSVVAPETDSEPAAVATNDSNPATAAPAVRAPGVPGMPRTVGFDPAVAERRRRSDEHWQRIVAAVASGEIFEGTVTSAVSGGLLVDIGGVQGFLPASQARAPEGAQLDALVKQTIPLKIQEVNQKRRRAVVSQRRALDETRRKRRGDLLRSLQLGQRHEARVVRLAPFGAFADIGSGIEGLIPMSELAFERIGKVEDLLKVGDTFPVTVLRLDEGGRKIALSRKNALPDPWRDHAEALRIGTVLEGTVVAAPAGTANTGSPYASAREPRLHVEIAPGIVGTVRDSDADPAQYEIGEKVVVAVRNVDRKNRRITLTTMHAAAAAGTFSSGGFAALGEELRKKLGQA